MGRKFIDCRAFPSEMNCTIAISADSESELLGGCGPTCRGRTQASGHAGPAKEDQKHNEGWHAPLISSRSETLVRRRNVSACVTL